MKSPSSSQRFVTESKGGGQILYHGTCECGNKVTVSDHTHDWTCEGGCYTQGKVRFSNGFAIVICSKCHKEVEILISHNDGAD